MQITGKVLIDGRETEFSISADGGYRQWGGSSPAAFGERVELMDRLGAAVREWASDDLCIECMDRLLDNGEGYDGRCGVCADRDQSKNREEEERYE